MSDWKAAVIAGVLFILATVIGMTVALILGPVLGAEAPLAAGYLMARMAEGLLLALGGLLWLGLLKATEAQAGLLMDSSAALFALGSEMTFGLMAPIALNEMVLAVWLIVKGFSGVSRTE